jgi:uncharacterized membrane protein (DUF2068 family)
MDWSLLGCGAGGHVTFAPDEPGLRERFGHNTREGQAWRCLRCGAFVIGEPTASGPADSAPAVRRGTQVRSALILRIFAVERFLRALVFAALAIAIWRFSASRLSLEQSYDRALPPLKALLRDLGFSVQHSKILGLLNEAFTTNPRILVYLAIGCAAYVVVEVIEGIGLWLVKRWGEYFAMIATSVGLPYEIYGLAHKVTALRVAAFLINLGLVVYLVVTKRLFGVRGGKAAYEARLRSESLLDAEIAALAAEQADTGRHAKPAAADEPGTTTEPAAARGLFEPAPEPPATHESFQAATDPTTTGAPFPPATEPPATQGPLPAATEPPVADGPFPPATEPPRAEEAPIPEPRGPAADEAPDMNGAGVTAPPPLPRRRRRR